MTCREVLDRLSPFLDEELDAVTSREIEHHLETCPDCRAALARRAALGEALRREAEYHAAPDLLRARLMRTVRAAAPRERPSPAASHAWRWLGAAAAALVFAGGTWLLAAIPRVAGDEAITREAVAGHVRSLMANHLTDVASTDQHTVKPWFAGRLDFSPPVVDLAASEFPLIGGRLDYLAGRPVAALVYQRRKHVINVFVWPATSSREEVARAETRQGYQVIRLAHAGMAFRVVSDLNAGELTAFARMLVAPRP